MPAPDQIPQGTSYYFIADACGVFEDAIYTLEVKQFPGSDPVIEKEGSAISSKIEFILTPEETASLEVGLWYLIRTTTLPNWYVEARKRVQVTKAWV